MAGREEERGKAKRKKTMGKEMDGMWPRIKAKKDLQINRLKGTHLFTVPNFLTAAEAKAFVDAAEAIGFAHQGSQGPAKGEAYRDNDRISVSDPVLAETIWESGLKSMFDDIELRGKIAVGLNPNIRFYRYKVGQRFGRHIDESVNLGEGHRTQYTLLIYLSGDLCSKMRHGLDKKQDSSTHSLVGGETVFYDERRGIVAEVAPVMGMALLHIHGDRCMLHEARAVIKNVKYVLRSDVVFA
ncbi:Prolyl 4-hydroxylase alpha subunit domain-containing protein [Dioscorea alata]|uniref:Prolyl 4-hydroxylase alpha subunit domain-containing protein n=1 Tax=Dioscorea alata TaxID=55571 RepID=A0ACB7U013_DIOAL|nr:Prolyl 4-hydroxylase alpha subunit domain-containing protein [Dioscorea alata]